MPVQRELVTLEAGDGSPHDALLHLDLRALRGRVRRSGRRTAILHAHGVMGNFLVGTLRFLPAPLARAGYPVLVTETRLANVGQLFGEGIFEDALLDLDAAVRFLLDEGFDRLVLSGYSSGATLATRLAAARDLPHLRGLVGLGSPWGLPQSAEGRSRRWGSAPSYERLAERVARALAAGEPDRLVVIERATGPSSRPPHCEIYTHQTWWHGRGPEATAAMTHAQIGRVRAPVLLVQGLADEVVHPHEAERLASVARAAGNADVEVVGIEGADHTFEGREQRVAEAVVGWLDSRA
jgi:dipeptidyl aminopeptidase/acylaminoacyl peptidase